MKKGFVEDVSGHHVYYRYYFQDKISLISTYVSHGATEIDDFLIGSMAKQVKLKKNDFLELVSCTLTMEVYRDRMLTEGHITN